VVVEEERPRSTPTFGRAKTGANYAAALRLIVEAKGHHAADQVLFAPGGDVQETGAANFLMIDDGRIVTKALDDSFLPGVTRASILELAAHLGYEVSERNVSVADLIAWATHGEAALSGTAAVLAGVGTLLLHGEEIRVGDGGVGSNTLRLRQALTDIQAGAAPDPFGWVTIL
jgi:branched-chain amino acid aminotransferase